MAQYLWSLQSFPVILLSLRLFRHKSQKVFSMHEDALDSLNSNNKVCITANLHPQGGCVVNLKLVFMD